MKSTLERIIRSSDKRDKTVFWLFWLIFVFQIPFKIAEKYAGDVINLRFPLDWALILGPILLGIIGWKILKWERISSLKNGVVGVQGLILFVFFSFVIAMSSLMVLDLIFDLNRIPRSLGMIPFGLFIVSGFFLGGCWLGFRIRKMIALIIVWSLIVVGLLYRGGLGEPGFYGFILIPGLLGTYLGTRHLAHPEEAT